MKHVLLAIILAFVNIGTANAASCDFSGNGLSSVAKQELKIACEQKILSSKQSPTLIDGLDVTNPEQLSKWGVVAQEWAKALGLAASELGISADKFLATSAGKLTAALIIWQVMGDSILGIVIGIPLLIATILIGLRIIRHQRIESITYYNARTFFGRKKFKQ